MGNNYRFAWELAHEASAYGVMHGPGNCVGYFTRNEVRRLVVEFARQNASNPRPAGRGLGVGTIAAVGRRRD